MNYESPKMTVVGKASSLIQAQVIGADDGHPPLKNRPDVMTSLEEE